MINLKDSVERRKSVLAETAKYPFMDVELVEAVDGRKMSEEEKKNCFDIEKFIMLNYRTPKGGEIGCTLSHRICYRRLLDSDEEFALILEDDVKFLYPEDMETMLKDILNEYKNNRSYFITLAYHFFYYPKKYRKLGKYTFYRIYNAYGTCAYLINRKAAKRLLSVSVPYTVADNFPFIRSCGVIVEGTYPTFAVGASTQQIIPTEIQEETTMYESVCIIIKALLFARRICKRVLFEILIRSNRISWRSSKFGINV